MKINKVVVGVLYNKRLFRLSSMEGILIDEILDLCENDKKLGKNFLSQFTSSNELNNMHIKFIDKSGKNSLTIQSDQFIFAKSAQSEDASVNIDKVIEEFEVLWKAIDKIVKFPSIRRLGLVTENHIKAQNNTSASNEMLNSLVKLPPPEHSGRFTLTYEDRELTNKGEIPDQETADFWNTIYTFYPSEKDIELPVDGKINANIDVQKYFNPAKADPLKEIRNVRKKFADKKKKFKSDLTDSGLIK